MYILYRMLAKSNELVAISHFYFLSCVSCSKSRLCLQSARQLANILPPSSASSNHPSRPSRPTALLSISTILAQSAAAVIAVPWLSQLMSFSPTLINIEANSFFPCFKMRLFRALRAAKKMSMDELLKNRNTPMQVQLRLLVRSTDVRSTWPTHFTVLKCTF